MVLVETLELGLKFNITFLPCPNRFDKSGSECVCEERLQMYNVNCNVDVSSIE